MSARSILLSSFIFMAIWTSLRAQINDSVTHLTGFVYDESFYPVPASHVINMNTHQGSVTDSLGIFRMPVRTNDTLLIRNIAFHDALVPARILLLQRYVIMKRKYYQLEEARIFEWGSTYGDFRRAIVQMPTPQTLGETMGLPRQDPDYIPFEMNEEVIKSPAFLISSPISFFYYNFSKAARSARKVYWLKKNRLKQEKFDEILEPANITAMTGLEGEKLLQFLAFLYQRLVCDFNCTELEIYEEIHALWKVYQELDKRQMLPSNQSP